MTHPSKHTLRLVSTTKTKTQSNLIWAGNFSRIAPKLMIANFRSPSWRRQLRPPEATDAEQSEWKPFDSRMGGNSKRGPSRLRHTRVHRGVPGRKREPMECSLGNHSLQRSKSPVQGSGQHDLDYIQWIYKSKLDRIYRFLTKYTKNHCVCFPHPRFVAVGHSLTHTVKHIVRTRRFAAERGSIFISSICLPFVVARIDVVLFMLCCDPNFFHTSQFGFCVSYCRLPKECIYLYYVSAKVLEILARNLLLPPHTSHAPISMIGGFLPLLLFFSYFYVSIPFHRYSFIY